MEEKLEELHKRCSKILDEIWAMDDPAAEAIINEQTLVIRDLIDIVKDYVSK